MEPDAGTPAGVGQLDWLLDDLVRRVAAGSGTCLAVIAGPGADLGLVAGAKRRHAVQR